MIKTVKALRSVCFAVLMALALSLSSMAMPAPGQAASQAEIEQAIEDGLAWLATQQNPDGSWGTSGKVGRTSLVINSFEHHALHQGLSPLDSAYSYKTVVQNGLNYIFLQAVIQAIAVQPAGNPDGNGNGTGVRFASTYETAIALMAIAASGEPGRIVSAGGAVNGWTYRQVAQDILDYFAWAQGDSGNGRGGWYYSANSTNGDNSIAGHVGVGLGYASADPPTGFGLTIPAFVKTELSIWIDYIQNDVNGDTNDGGSGYGHPDSWVNTYKTGHLIYQMALVGDSKNAQRVKDALDYLVRHWDDADSDPGWRGLWPGTPASSQAAWSIMKGLTLMGLDKVGGRDWYADFCDVFLPQQNANGSWPASQYPSEITVCTAYALLMLQKAAPGADAPRADFTARPTLGTAPLQVQFTDRSRGDYNTWLWDFGDGGTSNEQNPVHTYNAPGAYTIMLTVIGPGGPDTETKRNYIRLIARDAGTPRPSPVTPGPAMTTTTYLSVNPQQAYAGQPVTVMVNAVNNGNSAGQHDVVMKINGQIEQSQTVSVEPQTAYPVSFTIYKDQPGTYTVEIGGQQAVFTVMRDGVTTGMGGASSGVIAVIILGALVVVTGVVLLLAFRRRPA